MGHAAELQTDYLESLNPAQRQAATWGKKAASGSFEAPPLLVIAGAGTGKTMTLAHRVAHLIIQGVSPARILLLTFTRRAALEMTRRVEFFDRHSDETADGVPLPSRCTTETFRSGSRVKAFAHSHSVNRWRDRYLSSESVATSSTDAVHAG